MAIRRNNRKVRQMMSDHDEKNGNVKASGVFPNVASQAALVAALKSEDAPEMFRRALNDRDTHSRELRLFLADHPEQALAALEQDCVKLALSPKGAADALEIILGDMPPERARELMESQLTSRRRSELIQGRGDLPSVAAHIAGLPDVIRAVFEDIRTAAKGSSLAESFLLAATAGNVTYDTEDQEKFEIEEDQGENDEEDHAPVVVDMESATDLLAFSILYSWAWKLHDRPDFPEFLCFSCGNHTMRQYLIFAIALQEAPHEVAASTFDEFGMDPDEARAELRSMMATGSVPTIDAEAIERARALAIQRHRDLEEEPAVADDAREAAAEKAKKIGEF